MPRTRHADRILIVTLIVLTVSGFFIFLSASLGLFASNPSLFSEGVKSQLLLGVGMGSVLLFIGLRVPYRFWRRASLGIFIFSLFMTFLVFVPHIGLSLNGARRWIELGPITFQPSELLKIAYILYLATWFSAAKNKVGKLRYGFLPFLLITGLVALPLLVQPDNGTFLIIALTGFAMFFAAGMHWRDFGLILLIGLIGIGGIVLVRPYVVERVMTFLNPATNVEGSGYQIEQSLLAVGSGELFGRGFGQSIQKFGLLPEADSDAIFSVFAEEFGFVGSVTLIIIYIIFALRGLWIGARAPDIFGGLVAVGVVTLIILQSFVNIAAMIGIMPVSGEPLVFISHGGSALMVSLAAVGILLAVSKAVPT